MRLWSSRLLERELANGSLPQWEKTKYLLLPLILTALAGGPIYLVTPRYGPTPAPTNIIAMLLGGLVMALVTYFGIRMGFRANQEGDGRNFIERYTILSVPIFIRFAVGFIPCLIIIMFIMAALYSVAPGLKEHSAIVFRILSPLIMLWFYSLLAASIRRCGSHVKNKRPPIR